MTHQLQLRCTTYTQLSYFDIRIAFGVAKISKEAEASMTPPNAYRKGS